MVTFGVELEVTLPHSRAVARLMDYKTGYHGAFRQAPDFPDGWCAQNDSSIQESRVDDAYTAELVSPPLPWHEGIASVVTALGRLKALDARTNGSCGLHVHVGGLRFGDGVTERITALARRYEFALYGTAGAAIVARMAGVHGQHYCKPSSHGNNPDDRYQGLNLSNLSNERDRRTVEFRMFQGSIATNRVLAPLCMALALVLEGQQTIVPVTATRIPSPVEAMTDFLVGPWARWIADLPLDDGSLARTLLRQARKAETRLNVAY